MDPDSLQRFAGIIRKCIQFQEVTETAELMEKEKVTLNVHYTTAGEHNPNPNVPPRTYAAYLAATQAIREGHQLHFPPIPPPPSAHGTVGGAAVPSTAGGASHYSIASAGNGSSARGPAPSTANTVASAVSSSSALPPITKRPPMPPLVVDPLSPCKRRRGIVAVSEHTFGIYKWLQKGRDIAEPKVHTEVRRARKEPPTGAAARRAQGVTSPTSPRSTAASSPSAAAAASHVVEDGDDRQFYSVVVVVYGRVNFLLQDEMYFREDGALMIIDRFLVAPVDAASPHYVSDRNSFFKLGRSQVDRTNEKHAVIDFSFKGLKEPLDALRVAPITGAHHEARPFYKPPASERESETVTFGALEAQQGTRKLIVAKNRKGEEEAYEFEIKAILKSDAVDRQSEDDLMMQQLAARLASKYDGEVIRLCNNQMASAANLVPVLRNLVANHFLTVQWVDLSSNLLTDVPDLTSLPLRTLYLHANKIADWAVIEERVCTLPLLTSVTCHGNPIATKDPNYKQQLLMRLQRAKAAMAGSLPIKLVDFVAVSACDTQVAKMYSHFTLGGTVPLLPKFQKDGTLTPRGSPRSGRERLGEDTERSARGGSPRYQQPLMRTSPRRQQ